MPVFDRRVSSYKPTKKTLVKWDGWQGGWNNFYDDNELDPNELATATNCMLTGKGIVTPRWGSSNYHLAGSGQIRMLIPYYNPSTGQNDLLSITDGGYLTKKSGATNTIISGASFASGYDAMATQLGGNTYIVGGNREFVRYDGTTLSGYPTISKPTSVLATNFSGASGTFTYGWRVSAFTTVGETLATDSVQLVNLPQDLTSTLVKVSWTAPSTASGVLKGYSIYRGTPGSETFIGTVDQSTTTFDDTGTKQSETVFPRTADTTGGVKAKYILKLDDRLVVAGVDNDPSLVMISARYPYESRFHWSDGGGYVRIAPDDGDEVTGLGVVGSNVKGGSVPSTILVFKKRATYALVLKTVTIGNYIILDPQFQSLMPVGATSGKAISNVENDVFFLSRDGFYSVGSEPNFLNEIRSKEISTRIRNYISGLSDTDFNNAKTTYFDHKFICSFPTRNETIVYDYERRSWMGVWKTPFAITDWLRYYDSDGKEYWLFGADNGYVKYFSRSLTSDSGEAYKKLVVTKKEDFGDWTVMKIVELFQILFKNVKGTIGITIRGEDRDGVTSGIKSFTIQGGSKGVAGWGIGMWGDAQWGDSVNEANIVSSDFIRWSQLYKTLRVVQVEITSTGVNDAWELITIQMASQLLGIGSLSPETRA